DALAAVETRYPSYTEALRRQYLARVALRLEDTAYGEHLEEALISREVYADLQRDLKERFDKVNRRPPLDLGLDLAHLIAQVPLFQDLPPARQAELASMLRPDLAIPGERIITRGTRGTRMYFLVSGEVSVQLRAGDIVLGPGDFFGEMALLSNEPRNADITAAGFCHMLVLEARDFQRVIRSDPEIRAKIEQVAADRANARKQAAASSS
ncbi:MAG TPA: cyclic nucleotide-binding domain-containing protein, partial [Kiloniellales bacterium]|nr:cyclic nucleotide-binding domain-containing protein [Kiloniellales bacterium]